MTLIHRLLENKSLFLFTLCCSGNRQREFWYFKKFKVGAPWFYSISLRIPAPTVYLFVYWKSRWKYIGRWDKNIRITWDESGTITEDESNICISDQSILWETRQKHIRRRDESKSNKSDENTIHKSDKNHPNHPNHSHNLEKSISFLWDKLPFCLFCFAADQFSRGVCYGVDRGLDELN